MNFYNTTHYAIAGTKYYRLASKSLFGLYGSNMQNVDKATRKIYKPRLGYILNQRDQSGAEALIVAYLCKKGNFRDLFLNKIKPHCYVALHVFPEIWQEEIDKTTLDIKCDIDELLACDIPSLKKHPFWQSVDSIIKSSDDWKDRPRYYYIAKQICHSSNYGVGPGMFSLNTLEKSKGKVIITLDDAKKFLDIYHSLFPEIREWHREVEEQVRTTRYLYNLFGNPIYFSGDSESTTEQKEWYAAIAQSTVGIITRLAVTNNQRYIEEHSLKWDILQDNHDSYVIQTPIDEHLECHRIMKEFIEPELTSPRGEKFRMRSEGASGFNWSPYSEKYNLEGLKNVDV